MTWVVSDFAGERQGELSVARGQQVEVLPSSSTSTSSEQASEGEEMVLVRLMPTNATTATSSSSSASPSGTQAQTGSSTSSLSSAAAAVGAGFAAGGEGLVPASCLRVPPGGLAQLRSRAQGEFVAKVGREMA